MTTAPATKTAEVSDLVIIGAATFNRPQALARLLASLVRLETPTAARLAFVIVDNGDPSGTAEQQIADFARQVPWPVQFLREARPGIPHARNAILEAALTCRARFLCMLDDDEEATKDWAARLVDAMRAGSYALAGGPLEPFADSRPKGVVAHLVLAARQQDQHKNALRRARRLSTGEPVGEVYTNNCCIDLDMVRRTKLRFDPAYAQSGGSDAVFSAAVRAAGERVGWAPDALVRDGLPARRLTLGYEFRTARDIMLIDFARFPRSRVKLLGQAVELALYGVVLLFYSLTGSALAFVRAFRMIGEATGCLLALLGVRSRRYAAERAHQR